MAIFARKNRDQASQPLSPQPQSLQPQSYTFSESDPGHAAVPVAASADLPVAPARPVANPYGAPLVSIPRGLRGLW